ncbi:hypothetical protein AZF37_02585 [endosymbiont 'TC1' of Trimyema compressum]|uniref:ATP synthase F1 subunit delta n=1 Tax=endosymbiont 'TC1' of Trimyema compressum TaxID=243899 RepID=UPI0007F0EB46|nr:ATP synthase F1 subunit delta [endosymbiont 'TC1' of Trimyema compressum]AMP20210.1 hypothetical protein AZF37_02585 [endosymbiont 'TC1' of Trimyema compressum]
MVNVAVADRYSLALFQLAQERNQVDSVLHELEAVAANFTESPLLTETFRSKKVNGKEKLDILLDMMDEQKISQLVKEFFKVLLESKRELTIESVYKSFLDRYRRGKGIRIGILKTPYAISSEEKETLEKRFSESFNCQIQLEVVVDTNLIGGAVLEVDGVVYKDDIETRINRLTKWMKG